MGSPPLNPFLVLFCAFRINRLQTAISNRGDCRAAVLGMGREDHPYVKHEPRGLFRPRFAVTTKYNKCIELATKLLQYANKSFVVSKSRILKYISLCNI
jgi:hypothetical protein